MEIAINALILGVLIIAALQFLATRAFRARVLGLAAKLRQSQPVSDLSASVPKIVADYARRCGAEPGGGLRAASFTQAGTMRLKKGGPMSTLSAWQGVALGAPGFVWDGRIEGGGLRQTRVLDAFVDGEGVLEARLMGSIPVYRANDDEIALAEAYRYLAELPWVPDAMLGNPDIRWQELSPSTVRAALSCRGGEAAVVFEFDAAGDITGMMARGRPVRDATGKSVRLDWKGRFGDYRQIGPRRIPGSGEVGYLYPDGYEIAFKARLADYGLSA